MPSLIGICGNHKVDELADVGRPPVRALVNMVGRVDEGEEEEEEFDESFVLGMGKEALAEG